MTCFVYLFEKVGILIVHNINTRMSFGLVSFLVSQYFSIHACLHPMDLLIRFRTQILQNEVVQSYPDNSKIVRGSERIRKVVRRMLNQFELANTRIMEIRVIGSGST